MRAVQVAVLNLGHRNAAIEGGPCANEQVPIADPPRGKRLDGRGRHDRLHPTALPSNAAVVGGNNQVLKAARPIKHAIEVGIHAARPLTDNARQVHVSPLPTRTPAKNAVRPAQTAVGHRPIDAPS